MFMVVWFLPNTQQVMAWFAPTISKFDPRPERQWSWRPNLAWAVAIAVLFLVTLQSRLGDPAKFLYFQF